MTEPAPRPAAPPPRPPLRPRRSMAVCALIGAALMAAVDEIVFHQLLNWHHFYDRSTPSVGLLADGLLHTAEVLGLVTGFVLYADMRRRGTLSTAHARAGLLMGLGAFQLFDGIVDHKVLRTHQIRYGVDLLPYDLAWNGFGLVLLGTGAALAVRAGRAGRVRPPESSGAPESSR